MYATLYRLVDLIARGLAYAGGAVLVGLVLLTCLSIVGRAFVPLQIGLGPIRGIYDMTEIGIAAAIFAFLPWCQLRRGHAAVDLFTPYYPDRMNRLLDLCIDALMCVVAVVGTWRLALGLLDKRGNGGPFVETTLIAHIPVWWAYAASLVGAVGFSIVAAFCVLRSLRALAVGGESADEAVHE